MLATLIVNLTKAGYDLEFSQEDGTVFITIVRKSDKKSRQVLVFADIATDDLIVTEVELCMIRCGAMTFEQLRA